MRLEAKTACVFLRQFVNSDVRKKPGYTDAFWVSILLTVEMVLNEHSGAKLGGPALGYDLA